MLLEITTTHRPATDLGHLLRKNPARMHSLDLAFGKAHVVYPEASEDRCTAALVLDIDPIALVRGRDKAGRGGDGLLTQYVNDRPYAASSFLSVAIARVYRSALARRSAERAELVDAALPVEARIVPLPCRGGAELLRELFEPLGYMVEATGHPLDTRFPDWGASPYYDVRLTGMQTIADLLSHLYVLIPVLDRDKHYWVGEDEVEKLLRFGEGWLAEHPAKQLITARYLKFRRLARAALAQLADPDVPDPDEAAERQDQAEGELEKPIRLNDLRLQTVVEALAAAGARRVLDLGCGEGRLLRELLRQRQFTEIVGVDASVRALETARDRLKLDRLPTRQQGRITLLHGALTYRDRRLADYDAAAVVEVIEHLDPPRLAAFERALFGFARPATVVVTTPNREYNGLFPNLADGSLRHRDHRFEWTRAEFQAWAGALAEAQGYRVDFRPIGEVDQARGAPTQMAVFDRCD